MTETHPQNRLIGYARVSTYGQTLDAQLEQLRAAGCIRRNILSGEGDGRTPRAARALRMLDRLAPDDVRAARKDTSEGLAGDRRSL
jgi:DNA invertase Pin-like site-specific DNA recombinase